MEVPPAIVIHGIEDARAALTPGLPVTLLSAPDAALYAGCGFWRALLRQARAEFPSVPSADILDCADASGYALAALRLGQQILVLRADAPGRTAVAAIAEAAGAVLLDARPPALDLAGPGAARGLVAWLRG
ncbi:MAG: hypothetical protein ABI224_10650 [Acetobacteraceae bacterium]